MTDRRRIGSFYTPSLVAKRVMQYVSDKLTLSKPIHILEPSAGDGAFIEALSEITQPTGGIAQVTAVEKKISEVRKIQRKSFAFPVSAVHSDFLNFQSSCKNTFDLVIGNPPYIKKSLLTKRQVKQCEAIHRSSGLSSNHINNIWTAFLVRSIQLVNKSGILAFILPAEVLQVKFASELRVLLTKEFERIELFLFNELIFNDCKGQDTVLLVAMRSSSEPGLFISTVRNPEELALQSAGPNVALKETDVKWTLGILSQDEASLLSSLSKNIRPVGEYCWSKAGIVTAANAFFILSQKLVEEYSLQQFVKPIVQRGMHVNGSVVLNSEQFQKLVDDGVPTSLLVIPDRPNLRENKLLARYISRGRSLGLHKRYKMTKRAAWYRVPNIVMPAEGLFFKRCDKYPKLLRNDARVHVTDSAYVVSMADGYDIDQLILSFYNSLTLAYAEINGRHYGGGVLELTPTEFRGLPLPYQKDAPRNKFTEYVRKFERKNDIKDILAEYDLSVLKSCLPGITSDQVELITGIRERLSGRRTGRR